MSAAEKTVLVTGATGLIGRQALAPLKARGYRVHALARAIPDSADREVTWHAVDLLAGGGVEAAEAARTVKASHLLHLAWYAEPGKFWSSPENLAWVGASLALARAFVEAGGRRLVAAGSCAEYDWSGTVPLNETATPLLPRTLYGAAKHSLRLLLEAYAREARVSLAWGRVFLLYGPHEHPVRLMPSVILPLLSGRDASLSHGTQKRDFLHAADVAGAFAALLDSTVEGPVNVGSGEAVSVREVAERIAAAIGEVGGQGGPSGQGRLRFGEREDAGPAHIQADVARLRDEVGFRPRFDLEEGLRDAILWWRQEGPNP
ncbi:MAG TPA: NAD(P)-dependent oxidoreductase [Fibrobacteria bacterium]|nr:NAD(P)-dependent oxidoreductase [Fibrobacteria bacterium]